MSDRHKQTAEEFDSVLGKYARHCDQPVECGLCARGHAELPHFHDVRPEPDVSPGDIRAIANYCEELSQRVAQLEEENARLRRRLL